VLMAVGMFAAVLAAVAAAAAAMTNQSLMDRRSRVE